MQINHFGGIGVHSVVHLDGRSQSWLPRERRFVEPGPVKVLVSDGQALKTPILLDPDTRRPLDIKE